MALNRLGLGFVFTARDLASAKMKRLETRFSSLDERVTSGTQRMTGAFRQLGAGLAVFTAGAVTLGSAFALANTAGRFEQGIAAIGAVTRATSQQLDMLRDSAIQAGIATQFSPEEAVAGLQSLATAGQTAEQATRTLIPVLDLAAGSLGQLGVDQAAEAVVGTLNAYGLSAEHAANVTDRLLRITQLTNFQTRDFEAGLAKAAAAGSVFDQELDDVLITMGLLRNRNIDASSAATAFRESVRRVGADARAQQAILGAGVEIFDQQTGSMRSIVDIMSDFATATRSMSDEERNRRVVQAFGARGLLAFNAILKASFTTLRDGRQVTLQGAEAISALRAEMSGAEGTAADFRDQLLDTFEGQKTLLKGTLQTLVVALGEPFAKIFKPIVRAIVEALNGLLHVFQAIPAPVKKVLAGVVAATGGILLLVGGALVAKAAITLLGFAFSAMGISMGGLLATLWPVVLALGIIAAAVAGFVYAFKKNIGGIGDFFRRVWEKVRLIYEAFKQLFEQGGFSGAVRAELNRAENQGIKRFVISVYKLFYRLGQIWEGFKEGFSQAIEAAAPVFRDLGEAFEEMAQAIGELYAELVGGASDLPSASFRDFGATVGKVLGGVVRWFSKLLAIQARIVGGIARGFKAMLGYIRPALKVVGEAIGRLIEAFRELFGVTGEGDEALDESTAAWRVLGEVMGQIFGGVITVLTLALGGLIDVLTAVVHALKWVKEAFVGAGTWIGETAGAIYLWFTETLPAAINTAIDTVVRFFRGIGQFFVGIGAWFSEIFGTIVDGIASFLAPIVDFFRGIVRSIRAVFNSIIDMVVDILEEVPDVLLPESLEDLRGFSLSGDDELAGSFVDQVRDSRPESMPSVAETKARSDRFSALEAQMQRTLAQPTPAVQGPLTVQVQVDGETIATAVHNAEKDNASRSFSPLPVY